MTYLPQLQDDLSAAASRIAERPGRRSRGLRRSLMAASALAVAGITAALIIGVGTHGKLDVVSQAKAALAPAGQLVHVDLIVDYDMSSGSRPIHETGSAAIPQHLEQWSAEDPTRWRLKTFASKELKRYPGDNPDHVIRPSQVAWADGAQSVFSEDRNIMKTITGLSPRSSAATPLALSDVDNSLGRIREMLDAGALADQGLKTVDGRSVRRLTGTLPNPHLPTATVEYDIDPATFLPVGITTRRPLRKFSQQSSRYTLVTYATIKKYERLPLNATTAKLLTIQPPPGTKLRTRTLEEARAAAHKRHRSEQNLARDEREARKAGQR